jgi:hypothetical protein
MPFIGLILLQNARNLEELPFIETTDSLILQPGKAVAVAFNPLP